MFFDKLNIILLHKNHFWLNTCFKNKLKILQFYNKALKLSTILFLKNGLKVFVSLPFFFFYQK